MGQFILAWVLFFLPFLKLKQSKTTRDSTVIDLLDASCKCCMVILKPIMQEMVVIRMDASNLDRHLLSKCMIGVSIL